MAPQISFYNQGCTYMLRRKKAVTEWLGAVAAEEGFTVGGINYIFCSPEEHIAINRQYLGHDYYTDVITFDYSDMKDRIVSGDVYVDPATVRRNARHYGATARAEMLRVLVHGLLHLCGHGDKTPAEETAMREREDRYLAFFTE